MSDLDKLREKAQAATPELWRAYYDDYGEPASEDDLGYRPGTMLVAPDPFDGDRILIDGLTPQEAMRIVRALNVHEAALIDRLQRVETALPILRELALPSSMATDPDGECFFCGGDANEPEDHAGDCLVTLARAALEGDSE